MLLRFIINNIKKNKTKNFSKMMCGGFAADKPVTPEIQQLLDNLKSQVQSHMNASFGTFKALSYQSQVVAGTNYRIKVEVDDGKTLEVVIFQPLPYTGNPAQLTSAKFI